MVRWCVRARAGSMAAEMLDKHPAVGTIPILVSSLVRLLLGPRIGAEPVTMVLS